LPGDDSSAWVKMSDNKADDLIFRLGFGQWRTTSCPGLYRADAKAPPTPKREEYSNEETYQEALAGWRHSIDSASRRPPSKGSGGG
jgi:hypothetical protein